MSRFQRALNFVEGLALDDRRHPDSDHLRRGLFPPGFIPKRAPSRSNAAGIQGLDHLLDTQRSALLISFKAELEDQPHGLGFNSVERSFPMTAFLDFFDRITEWHPVESGFIRWSQRQRPNSNAPTEIASLSLSACTCVRVQIPLSPQPIAPTRHAKSDHEDLDISNLKSAPARVYSGRETQAAAFVFQGNSLSPLR